MITRSPLDKGRHVSSLHTTKNSTKNLAKLKEIAEKSRSWIQASMAADAEK